MDHNQSPVHIKGYRNICCPYYGTCLDHAAKNHWKYWACLECRHSRKQSFGIDILPASENSYPYYSLSPSIYEKVEKFSL